MRLQALGLARGRLYRLLDLALILALQMYLHSESIMTRRFEWDDVKAEENRRKHGIRFGEAAQIFEGPVLTRVDDRFGYGELREISIGLLGGVVVLNVAHTDRDGVTRIISARKATRQERRLFHTYLERTLG